MNCVLVTGAAGLLGAHLTRSLLTDGFKVIGIDNLEGGYKEFLPSHRNFKFFKADLNDSKKIMRVFDRSRPEAVFHFAAYAAEGLSPYIRRFNYTNNILASSSVINSAINFQAKVIFTSSMGVYGHQQAPFSEDMTPKPSDPYGIAKYSVELDLAAAKKQFGLEYSIVRPHNVVGIYQNIWDRYRNVLGIFVRQAIAGEPLTIYGDGDQLRAFSDVQFYMEPFKRLLSTGDGEIFNIGADEATSITKLAEAVKLGASRFGIKASTISLEEREEVKYAFCRHEKARSLLGFEDKTDLDELISKMFVWALKQKPKRIKSIPYEVDKGIYSYWK